MKAFACLAALVLVAAAQAAAQTTCPIQPEKQDLDFSAVATSCADAKAVCSACTCALVDVYAPALAAGGVAFDPNDPSSFPLETVAGIIRACSEQYIVSMLMANVNVTALSALTACTYTADNVPSCLGASVAALAAGNATAVKATGREAEAVPAGTTDLRVATVQKTDATVMITLAGQLSSATQLLQVLAASSDLVAALSPEVAQKLQAMAAAPGNIDQSPATAGTLAALNNPIDAVMLISNLAQLQAAAPAPPAAPVDAPAAPAPAPAPASGAGIMASPLMATVASVLLVVALL